MLMMHKKYKLVVFNTAGEYLTPEKFVSSSVDGIICKLATLSKMLWKIYPLHAVVDTLTNTIVDLTDTCLQDIWLEEHVHTVDEYSVWLKENSRTSLQTTVL